MLASPQATAAYAAAFSELPENFRLLDGLHVVALLRTPPLTRQQFARLL